MLIHLIRYFDELSLRLRASIQEPTYIHRQFRSSGPDIHVDAWTARASACDRPGSCSTRDCSEAYPRRRGWSTPSGLLAKLGITKSYVLINTFLYSVYGSVKAEAEGYRLVAYRNLWIDAIVSSGKVEAVLALARRR